MEDYLGATCKRRRPKPSPYAEDLTDFEQRFIVKYIELGDAKQAAIEAGFKGKDPAGKARTLLKKERIAREVTNRQAQWRKRSIATGQEVMEYFTKVMNGEIKDQFDLDAPLAERTRAAVELAKRTVDIENRLAEKQDNQITIKLDWGREEE